MEQAVLLEKVKAATVGILIDPGPLASRPRQIESYAKLDLRLSDQDYLRDQLKVYFDIAGGVGKTVMFGRAVEKLIAQGLRVLAVTPRVELVNQTGDKFELHFGDDAEVALIQSKQRRQPTAEAIESADVAIITNASLLSRIRSGQLNPKDWDVVIWDEAHLTLGPENVKLIEDYEKDGEVVKAAFSHAFQMAFTASGEYNLFRSVANIFGPPVDSINTADAVEGNLLASIKTAVVRSGIRIGIEDMEMVNGNYDQKSINISARNLIAAQLYANFSDPETGYRMFGERGMLFCAGVDHAQQVAAVFNLEVDPLLNRRGSPLSNANYQLLRQPEAETPRAEYDQIQFQLLSSLWQQREWGQLKLPALPAALIHGESTTEHQRLIHDCFEHGLIKAVSNADMWTFGIDKPFATFALNLTPTTSLPKSIQRGTRVDRLDPERHDKVCYVIDVLDEDVWEKMQAAARDPKVIFRNRPRLFAEVLNWRPSVSNAFIPQLLPPAPTGRASGNRDDEPGEKKAPTHLQLSHDQVVMSRTELTAIYNTFQQATEKQTIEITDEMRAELNAQFTRTGCASTVTFNGLQKSDRLPNGFKSSQMIENWRRGGSKIANPLHWTTVMEWQREQPDATPRQTIEITDEMLAELEAEITRTGCGYAATFSGLQKSGKLPEGLNNSSMIENWRRGKVKTVDLRHWELVIAWQREQPDATPRQTIEITDEMLAELEAEITRTGCASTETFKGLQKSGKLPEGLNNRSMINRWHCGANKTVDPLHWTTVMEWQREQPDAIPRQTIEITDEILAELEAEITRTGCSPTATFIGLQKNGRPPKGFNNRSMIESWRSGKAKTADRLHWVAVMDWQREQPDASLKAEKRRAANSQNNGTGIVPDDAVHDSGASRTVAPKLGNREP